MIRANIYKRDFIDEPLPVDWDFIGICVWTSLFILFWAWVLL